MLLRRQHCYAQSRTKHPGRQEAKGLVVVSQSLGRGALGPIRASVCLALLGSLSNSCHLGPSRFCETSGLADFARLAVSHILRDQGSRRFCETSDLADAARLAVSQILRD